MNFTSSSQHDHHAQDEIFIMPRLLFWQYLVLFFVIGIIATRFFALALCAGFLLLFPLYFAFFCKLGLKKNAKLGFPKGIIPFGGEFERQSLSNQNDVLPFFLRIFLCAMCSVFAFYYTPIMSPRLEKVLNPLTLQEYSEKTEFDSFNNPMQNMFIQGKIQKTQSLPHGRLRFFLEDVKPLTGYRILENGETKEAPLIPQILSFTWDRAPYFFSRPVAGQSIIANTKIRETYGEIGDYWATKGIWYTAFNYKEENIFWTGQGNVWERARERLRLAFVENVFETPTQHEENTELTSQKKDTHVSQKELATHLNNIEKQARAILPALLFGDRFYLSALSIDTFNSANILHSLALSGQHLALTTILGALCVSLFIAFRPNILMQMPRRELIFYASIPFALAYVFLGSAPFSLLRAFSMFVVAGFFWIFARPITLIDCLFFALAFFCLFEPLSIFDLGVQLSFLSVFTIAFFMPIIRIPSVFFQKQEREILKQKNRIKKILDTKSLFQIKNNVKRAKCPEQEKHIKKHTQKQSQRKEKGHVFTLRLALFSLFLKRVSIIGLRGFCTLFLVSLCIQITNLPIIITYFGKASYFFLLNILWLPVLACIVLPFSAFALLFTLIELLIIHAFPLSFLLDLIQFCTNFCIEIAIYPTKILLNFLIYLQNIGFDPFIQFYKPHKISILFFYALLLVCLFLWSVYKNTNTKKIKNTKQLSLSLHTQNLLRQKYLLVSVIFLLFLCISPFIYNHFFQEKHFTLTVFDVGQGQSVLMENTLHDSEKIIQSQDKIQSPLQGNILKGRILIDAGGAHSPHFNVGRDILAHKLTNNHSPKLSYAIASHDDADHINGFPHIMQYFDVPALAEPYVKQISTSQTRKKLNKILTNKNIPVETLGMGDILDLGNGFALQVLHPPYPLETAKAIFIDIKTKNTNHQETRNTHNVSLTSAQVTKTLTPSAQNTSFIDAERSLAKPFENYSSNNSSLVLRLVKDGKGLALICGDVEKDVLEELVKYEENAMWTYNPASQYNLGTYADKNSLNLLNWSLQAHVLILAHHGSKNSYLPSFYEHVKAQTVIASAGKYNRYGFPAQEIEEYFKEKHFQDASIDFLVTAHEGDIKLKWQGERLILQDKPHKKDKNERSTY